MNDRKPQHLLTQLKEKTDKNGNTYFIGDLTFCTTITVFKHKTKDDLWNVFVSEKEKRDEPKQDGGSDGFPF